MVNGQGDRRTPHPYPPSLKFRVQLFKNVGDRKPVAEGQNLTRLVDMILRGVSSEEMKKTPALTDWKLCNKGEHFSPAQEGRLLYHSYRTTESACQFLV